MNRLLRLWSRVPQPVRSHVRALVAVAVFGVLQARTGDPHLDWHTALDAAGSAVIPVLMRWLDPTDSSYGVGKPAPEPQLEPAPPNLDDAVLDLPPEDGPQD